MKEIAKRFLNLFIYQIGLVLSFIVEIHHLTQYITLVANGKAPDGWLTAIVVMWGVVFLDFLTFYIEHENRFYVECKKIIGEKE